MEKGRHLISPRNKRNLDIFQARPLAGAHSQRNARAHMQPPGRARRAVRGAVDAQEKRHERTFFAISTAFKPGVAAFAGLQARQRMPFQASRACEAGYDAGNRRNQNRAPC